MNKPVRLINREMMIFENKKVFHPFNYLRYTARKGYPSQ